MNSMRLAPPSAPRERTSSLITHLKPAKLLINAKVEPITSTKNDVPSEPLHKSTNKSKKHKRYSSISNPWKTGRHSKSRRRHHESKKRSRKRELKKLKKLLKKHMLSSSKEKNTLKKLHYKNKKSKLRKRKYEELRDKYKEFVFDKNDYRIRKVNKNIERREKRHRKENILKNMKELNEKEFVKFRNVRFRNKLHHWIFKMKHFGPKVYQIRLSIIQMKIYLLNAFQGLGSLAMLLYFHLINTYNVPSALAIPGLYIIAYSACALDIFGSIFGIITSYHLERFYGFRRNGKKMLKKKGSDKKSNKLANPKLRKDINESVKPLIQIISENGKEANNIPDIKKTTTKSKEQKNKEKTTAANVKKSKMDKIRKLALSSKNCCKRLRCKSNRVRPNANKDPKKPSDIKTKSTCVSDTLDCIFNSLWIFFDGFFLLLLFLGKGKRSRKFVNVMGYLAWICTQLAWFLDLVFSAYYNWLSLFSQTCKQTLDRCETNPQPAYCIDFEKVFWFISGVVGVRFFLRIFYMFIIGLCFRTAPLRNFPPKHQESERPSSCSLSDVDYKKVPKPLLRPYREKPWLPLWPTTKTLTKTEKPEGQKKGGNPEQKRILTAKERHHEQVLETFKDVRRAKVQVNERREGARLRRVAGAPNTFAMPPDLMTAEARAWLSEETDTSMERENIKMRNDRSFPHHHFHQSRHKHLANQSYNTHKHHSHHAMHHVTIDGKLEDSDSLTIIHSPDSKTKVPIRTAVQHKLKDLSERVSTDESWSGHTFSFYESITEDEVEKENESPVEDYMELRQLMEAAGDEEPREEEDPGPGANRNESWGGPWSSSDSEGGIWWKKWAKTGEK